MLNRIGTFALSLVVASTLFAQDVQFSAKVEDGEDVCYYCPGSDYVIDNTHCKLVSSTINLAPFIGQYVKGTGVWNGSTTNPTVQVTSMVVAGEGFTIGGGGALGGEIQFTAHGNPGESAFILLGATDSFIPAGNLGVLYLNPSSMFVLGQGTLAGDGEFSIDIDVPNLPSLSGVGVFGQAVIGPVGAYPRFTNSDRKVLG